MKVDTALALVDHRWPRQVVASTSDLAAAGLDSRVLTAAVQSGAVFRLRRGAYVRSSYWNTLTPCTAM
ncbi:type IV toxin-antitoxin system AbiEi family antitoxin domain-containing protein [Pseudarthrobacter sp. C4D7]|uniref:type IV toxin-antitoxin system AbiEi family antitoxin domain-containing protein n=1 Tax=Pseudarthrobacter sp. C4D7 TaxID=2735268 RepID=UPI00158546BE|nr:type IV toxin-antitoxin system AbiEi family antitoxin domain-containing protein [Pseudarthrobacter sp. C4D7]